MLHVLFVEIEDADELALDLEDLMLRTLSGILDLLLVLLRFLDLLLKLLFFLGIELSALKFRFLLIVSELLTHLDELLRIGVVILSASMEGVYCRANGLEGFVQFRIEGSFGER